MYAYVSVARLECEYECRPQALCLCHAVMHSSLSPSLSLSATLRQHHVKKSEAPLHGMYHALSIIHMHNEQWPIGNEMCTLDTLTQSN